MLSYAKRFMDLALRSVETTEEGVRSAQHLVTAYSSQSTNLLISEDERKEAEVKLKDAKAELKEAKVELKKAKAEAKLEKAEAKLEKAKAERKEETGNHYYSDTTELPLVVEGV
jgi:hypothetical protein